MTDFERLYGRFDEVPYGKPIDIGQYKPGCFVAISGSRHKAELRCASGQGITMKRVAIYLLTHMTHCVNLN